MSENPNIQEERAPSFLTEILGLLKSNISQYFMFIALVVIMIFFTITTDGVFISSRKILKLQMFIIVWDMQLDSESNIVEVNIRRLRQKVDDPYPRKLIHTMRGRGYVIR